MSLVVAQMLASRSVPNIFEDIFMLPPCRKYFTCFKPHFAGICNDTGSCSLVDAKYFLRPDSVAPCWALFYSVVEHVIAMSEALQLFQILDCAVIDSTVILVVVQMLAW